MVMAALARAGYFVAVPLGDNSRYDLIAERDNKLLRVQVKTGARMPIGMAPRVGRT